MKTEVRCKFTLFSALFLFYCCSSKIQGNVVFYEDAKFRGIRTFLSLAPGCFTFSDDWSRRITSVDLEGNCIVVWDRGECSGRSLKLAPGSSVLSDLSFARFDNAIVSINVCRGSSSGPFKRVSNTESEVWRVGLEEHNKLRRLHGVPNLRSDPDLHRAAQKHADYLARANKFETSPDDRYGENLSTSFKKNKFDAIREVVKRWYDKIEFFDFQDPDANGSKPKGGLFSSIVWRSTTHAGIGVARNERAKKWVIVVYYDPAATKDGYKENVPRPLRTRY